ncbi:MULTISPECIES: fimbria/pilus outer membrane usher protein [unclassified Erwinia]|uniref:fimbria/pilus outer membrane usher protein n=1 Tax=unclassified Erwinia TaxID=2622719 RepID=UPI00130476F0|nr:MULTISPECIES: fimbria/pilus outer membrane usher protein [unclassified Erwinia]
MKNNRNHLRLRLTPVAACVVCLLAGAQSAAAREYFNPAFLGAAGAGVDLSAFDNAGYIPPGHYMVDVFMNQNHVETRDISFKELGGKTVPVLTLAQLSEWGVNVKAIASMQGRPLSSEVTDLGALIPQASDKFNFQSLRLDLSVPQESMQPEMRGRVDPSLWDEGIPALMLSYNVNGNEGRYESQINGARSRSLFATFRDGVNLGAWRLRSTQTWSYSDMRYDNRLMRDMPAQKTWRTSNTYLQRDVQALRGEMTLGETSTGGDVFDGIPFRGVQMVSDDAMLPDSMQGFAPVITGTANSNAQVTISQNGYVVYQTTVAPGPFRITDLYATGGAGDLTVRVKEADGTTHLSTVAYSSLPVMLRQGAFKYEVSTGKYHGGNLTEGSREPNFVLGTLIYGLPYNMTTYGGGLLASNYQSAALGAGFSLGDLGSLSADVTQSRAKLPGLITGPEEWKTGQYWRVRYSKSLMSTGTSVDLAMYRYSTRNYYSFSDVNSTGYALNEWQVPWALDRRRSTTQVSLNQSLGAWGSVYLSASKTRYWDSQRADTNMNAGYNVTTKGVSWGLNYSVDRISEHGSYPQNRQLSLNVQIPFSLFGPQPVLQGMSAGYGMTHDNQGRVTQNASVSGSVLDNRLSWSAQQGWGNGGMPDSSSLYLNYMGSQGTAMMGYSNGGSNRNFSYGASGALMAHPYGVTLSRSLGEGAVLVRAPGAGGVNVNSSGVATDWRGYAVVPSVSPYRRNSISVDPTTLPEGADIEQSSLNLYPTRGAVVLADYKVTTGEQLLMTLQRHGQPVPFGAMATLDERDRQASGIVGDGGRVYMAGMPPEGRIRVKWGNGADQQCSTTYRVSGERALLSQLNADCR